MKTRFIFILPLLMILIGCSDSDADTAILEITPSTFNDITSQGSTIKVSITSNSSWKVSSNQSWCVPNKQNGSNDGEVIITIHTNTTDQERNAVLTVISQKVTKRVKITQAAATTPTNEYHYKLPIIFHVLYKDRNNRNQYVEKSRLAKIIEMCNLIYKNKIYQYPTYNISQDMNLEFVMATEDPNGSPLQEAGIERIEWPTASMSCEEFMDGKDRQQAKEYAKMLWNPKLYINIFLYQFTEENILGISHLPYALSSYPLEGVNRGDYYLSHEVDYPHCISINNTYIYTNGDDKTYYTTDVYNTLSHELGHYLGLHHAFSEPEGDEDSDSCKDTDYCKDTPSYNISGYTKWVNSISDIKKYTFDELCARKSCEGEEYTSHNIMDYAFCYSDQFTLDQRRRIRHVLSYSPLIPDVKLYTETDTRSLYSDERPPIQVKH